MINCFLTNGRWAGHNSLHMRNGRVGTLCKGRLAKKVYLDKLLQCMHGPRFRPPPPKVKKLLKLWKMCASILGKHDAMLSKQPVWEK